MNFLTDVARDVTAYGVARQLGPAHYVSPIPAIISCVVLFLCITLTMLFGFRMSEGVDTVDPGVAAGGAGSVGAHTGDNKHTKSVFNGYVTAFIIGVTFAAVPAAFVYKFQWGFANRAYAAAQSGMNALYGNR